MPEIHQHNIIFKREDNPECFGIVDDYNSLIERLNKLYDTMQNCKIPKFVLSGIPEKLLKLGLDIREFDKSFLVWKERALKFTVDPPKLTFRSDGDVGYLHVTGVLRDMINNGTANVRQLISDYNLRHTQYENRKNVTMNIFFFIISTVIAVASFILGLFSLILALKSIIF